MKRVARKMANKHGVTVAADILGVSRQAIYAAINR
jgi:peptide deformylase